MNLGAWLRHPMVVTRGHLLLLGVMLAIPACVAMLVSLQGRIKLDHEIRRSLAADHASLIDRQLTSSEIASIAQTQAMLLQPTTRQQLDRINAALKVCASHVTCRVAFVRTVNRIVATPTGRQLIVRGSPPKAPMPTVIRQTIRKTVVQPTKPGPPGKDATGKTVIVHQLDSHALDAVDNTVHGLESTVGALGGRVNTLESRLAGLLGRLCTLLKVCQ